MSTIEEILKPVAAIVLGLIVWIFKGAHSDIRATERELQKLKEEIPKTYFTKEDFRHFEQQLFPILYRIEARIDRLDKEKGHHGD